MDEKKLISLVEQNSVVFDVNNVYFNCISYKNRIWNQIGEQLGTTGKMCKQTWTKIRNRYLSVRNHRKLTNKKPHEIIHKWLHEDEMQFYTKYLAKRSELHAFHNRVLGANSSKNQPDQPADRNDGQQISIDDDTEDFVEGSNRSSENEDEGMTSKEDDVLKTFFDAMLETVNGFSDRAQHNAKAEIFSIVSKLEEKELDFKAIMKP